MKYQADDRGNVVDFYGSTDSGDWDKVARLDREAGATADQLSWDNQYADSDLEAWAIDQGYPIREAEQGIGGGGDCKES